MPLREVRTKFEATIFSPFSGLPAETDSGVNQADNTLLFVHYGGAGEFGFISDRLIGILGGAAELSLEELKDALNIEGAFVLTVDSGWNGVNSYCFAP